jgi:hypothetical protein
MPVVSAVPSVVKQSNQTLPIFTVYREERVSRIFWLERRNCKSRELR